MKKHYYHNDPEFWVTHDTKEKDYCTDEVMSKSCSIEDMYNNINMEPAHLFTIISN